MDHGQHCAALEMEIEQFALTLDTAPLDAAVPTCPGWTVEGLASHLGTIHRWAEHLVRTLAPRYQSSRDMDLDLGPVNAGWIRRGGAALLETLRGARPDAPMWAWGTDQHARFWSRRQLHETLVHRADLELASGRPPVASPDVAGDAIDELLVNLKAAQVFSPNVAELRGDGQVLAITATDVPANWSIRLTPAGFDVKQEGGTGDARLSGPALELLLVLYRRRALAASSLLVEGDGDLADFWLAHSALQ